MNIAIVLAGGTGKGSGVLIPNQYNLIAGRPVIDYVLDAVNASGKTDKTVIVMDRQWFNYSAMIREEDYDIVQSGETRMESLYNALKHIKANYACDKVVILDANAPFIYGDLIDEYFSRLDEYDTVITAQKITGGFTDIHDSRLDREQYIITQSPEGFRFELLWKNYDLHFPYQEIAGMLPDGSKRYYNFQFRNNVKLTHDFELTFAELMLQNLGKLNSSKNVAFFDKDILLTEGLKMNLLRTRPEETMKWVDMVYANMPRLIAKWGVTSFLPNQISRYGLVLQAVSRIHGEVILKFIPDFVNRYERELEAMKILPKSYMCGLMDVDEQSKCMLMEKITPARYACFEENLKLTEMFRHVIADAVPYSEDLHLQYIPLYFDELKQKLEDASTMPYCRDLVEPELRYAVALFEQEFADAPLYVMHGDLHELNILDNGKRFYGIDPGGMLGPLELECVRFIRNDVRNHPAFGYDARFDILLRSFGRFVDIRRLVCMFIIDMAYCTFNSTFENEDPAETYVDLELIRIAKEWRKNNA